MKHLTQFRSSAILALVLVTATGALSSTSLSQQPAGGSLSKRLPFPRPHAEALFPARQFTVGAAPRSVAVGDLDGDLDQDVVTANFGTGNISVLRNFGNGTFADATSLSAGMVNNQARAVVLGDLDGDSDLDLVIASYGSNSFKVRLNNGDATFGALVSYAMGTNPTSIQLGDIDGDTDLDVAVTNYASNTVSIRKNIGNGTFPAVTSYATGNGPNSVAFVDVDGDTDLDLAVANTNSSSVTIHLNDGTGALAAAVSYATGNGASSVVAADLDGDTDPDLAVATFGASCVSILENNGNGTFAAASSQGPGSPGGPSYARQVVVADLDGDLDPDLAIARSRDDGDLGILSILVNAGNGTFSEVVAPLAGQDPRSVAAADLDGDSDLDLVVAHHLPGVVSILENDGQGSMTGARPSPYVAAVSFTGFTLADLDGDTDLDVATAGQSLGGSPFNRVWIHKNVGNGEFLAPTYISVGTPSVARIASGDLDGDGDVDLATPSSFNTVLVLKNTGNGTFSAPQSHFVGTSPASIAIADLDGDLDLDLVIGNGNRFDVSVLLNDGTGAFPSVATYGPASGPTPTNGPRDVSLADVDGDNDTDILAGVGTLGLMVLLNNGDGTFGMETIYDPGAYPMTLASADLDGDGDADIGVLLNTASASALSVLLNNGDGTFAAPVVYSRNDYAFGIAIAELDGDLRPELVTVTALGAVALYRNLGNGSFVESSLHHAGASPTVGSTLVLAADLDGDGDVDLSGPANAGGASNRTVLWTLENQRIP